MHKYGRDFSAAVMENRDGIVADRVSLHVNLIVQRLCLISARASLIFVDCTILFVLVCPGGEEVDCRYTFHRIGRCIPNRNSKSLQCQMAS